MIDIALQRPVDQTQLRRLAHGGASLVLLLALLFLVMIAAQAAIQPKSDLLARLNARATSVETLETALKNQQAELSNNLHLIGADNSDWDLVLSSPRSVEAVKSDADAVTSEIEALGFTLSSRTAPAERPLTPAFSVTTVSLNFTGDAGNAAAFASAEFVRNVYIASLRLNSEDAAASGGAGATTLSITLGRIGAGNVQDEGERSE